LWNTKDAALQHGVCLHVSPEGVWDAKLLFHTHVQNPEFYVAQWNAVTPLVGT